MMETTSQSEKPIHQRFFRITQTAYIIGFFGHLSIVFVFYVLQVWELVWFNIIISVPFFSLAYILNRRDWHSLAFSLAFTELLVHQTLAIYLLGWDGGFQFMFIYLTGLTFFNIYWKNWVRILLLAIILSAFVLLYVFIAERSFYQLPEVIYHIFYFSNVVTLVDII